MGTARDRRVPRQVQRNTAFSKNPLQPIDPTSLVPFQAPRSSRTHESQACEVNGWRHSPGNSRPRAANHMSSYFPRP